MDRQTERMTESEKVKGKGGLKVREVPRVPGTACLILREKNINKEMEIRQRRCLGWDGGRTRWGQSGKG